MCVIKSGNQKLILYKMQGKFGQSALPAYDIEFLGSMENGAVQLKYNMSCNDCNKIYVTCALHHATVSVPSFVDYNMSRLMINCCYIYEKYKH